MVCFYRSKPNVSTCVRWRGHKFQWNALAIGGKYWILPVCLGYDHLIFVTLFGTIRNFGSERIMPLVIGAYHFGFPYSVWNGFWVLLFVCFFFLFLFCVVLFLVFFVFFFFFCFVCFWFFFVFICCFLVLFFFSANTPYKSRQTVIIAEFKTLSPAFFLKFCKKINPGFSGSFWAIQKNIKIRKTRSLDPLGT